MITVFPLAEIEALTPRDHREPRCNAVPCLDCKRCTRCMGEYYMVHDELWEMAGGKRGCLCIGCLEARLNAIYGEPMQLDSRDFFCAPINNPFHPLMVNRGGGGYGWSERLLDRLGELDSVRYLNETTITWDGLKAVKDALKGVTV